MRWTRPKGGFTLLEVMLALALSALLIGVVGMAIDFHLRLLDSGRTNVEEAQLARALLSRIADDLRSAVAYQPVDVEKLVPELSTGADQLTQADSDLLKQAEAAGYDVGQIASAAGVNAGQADDAESKETTDVSQSAAPPSEPGLYGNATQLQVDTSRLPRIDQYDAALADRLSDVKTVAYYLDKGLVRREMDRATAAWAAQQGQLADATAGLEPIAPEVTAIEFRYYDGAEWVDTWDSAEKEGLPLAVEIAIAIGPTQPPASARSAGMFSNRSTEASQPLVYRLLVHLPTAMPKAGENATQETQGEETEMEEETQ